MRMDSAAIDGLKKSLLLNEGSEEFVYQDSLGYYTIGIGRCIDRRKGKGLSLSEQLYLLDNDIENCKRDLNPFVWYQNLDDIRKCVMIELCFNLGLHGLLSFKRMIAALNEKNYLRAISELKDSKWSTQVGKKRVANICYRLKNGSYPAQ